MPTIAGRHATPGYHCPGKVLVEGRGVYCLNIGGVQIDEVVARAFIAALEPAALTATLAAAERLESDREAVLKLWRLGVERASYEAQRAERRYRRRPRQSAGGARPRARMGGAPAGARPSPRPIWSAASGSSRAMISQQERDRLLALGPDLVDVWQAATTTPRDRKELLRTPIEEVIVKVERDKAAQQRRTSLCAGRAARSTRSIWPCRARGQRPSAPMRTRPHWYAGSRFITPTVLLPASSIGRGAPRHMVIASLPAASATCVATGISHASSRPPARPRANY